MNGAVIWLVTISVDTVAYGPGAEQEYDYEDGADNREPIGQFIQYELVVFRQ